MSNQPPKYFLRFFRWFCHPRLQKPIEGDLMELYEERVKEMGKRKADRKFRRDVLQLFRKDIIKPADGTYRLTNYGMLKHYFKTTWRSLLRQKLYSAINIGGLAIGLTCFILIFLFGKHELSYDQFHDNHDQIYRIYNKQASSFSPEIQPTASTPASLPPALVREYPEVLAATSIRNRSALLEYGSTNYLEKGLLTDANFFKIFSFSFLQGDLNTALSDDASIIITESLAIKLFGASNPIGEQLSYQNKQVFTITGVLEDPPLTSSLKFSFIANLNSYPSYKADLENDAWTNNSFHTFLRLKPNSDAAVLQVKLPKLLEKYQGQDDSYPFHDTYYVQPFTKLHLETSVQDDIGVKGSPTYLTLFSLVSIVILLLASINYMNLAVTRSIKRSKEIGMRKVVGASRQQLITQFLGESILISFFSLILALILVFYLIPVFEFWLERSIGFVLIDSLSLLPWLFFLVVSVGLIAGSYPAFYISKLRPAVTLKGKMKGSSKGPRVLRWMIIGQYSASIILVIGSIVIYQQFKFINSKGPGYDKEHIVTIPLSDRSLRKHLVPLKNEWLTNHNVISSTVSSELPTNITSSTIINDDEGSKNENELNIYRTRVDENFLTVFGLELVAGRNFMAESALDKDQSYILNETAARVLGWTPEEAIGKHFTHNGVETVIGVIKDFHHHSMRNNIEPLMIRYHTRYLNHISIKISSESITETILYLEKTIAQYSTYPFEYKFLDEEFELLYKEELKFGKMLGFFTAISFIVASMGLFGMAAFTAGQRTKEMGIRKVMGANGINIATILASDFLKMVIVGFLFAIPVGQYVMQEWLQSFAYRIQLEWWIFAISGLFAIAIAMITVSSQAIKVALINPVDSLKNE